MLLKLMPYVEQSEIYDRIDFKAEGGVIKQFEKNAAIRGIVLPVLRCPSDDFPAY